MIKGIIGYKQILHSLQIISFHSSSYLLEYTYTYRQRLLAIRLANIESSEMRT